MSEKWEKKRTCNNNRTQKDHSGVIQTLARGKWEETRSIKSTGIITNILDITQCKTGYESWTIIKLVRIGKGGLKIKNMETYW